MIKYSLEQKAIFIGDEDVYATYHQDIDGFLENRPGVNIEPIQGVADLFSSRAHNSMGHLTTRLFWYPHTTADNQLFWLFLGLVENHDYHKFLKAMQNHLVDNFRKGKAITEFNEYFHNINHKETFTGNLHACNYRYNGQRIRYLTSEQASETTRTLPGIIHGAPGSGKTMVAEILLKNLLENHIPHQYQEVIYIAPAYLVKQSEANVIAPNPECSLWRMEYQDFVNKLDNIAPNIIIETDDDALAFINRQRKTRTLCTHDPSMAARILEECKNIAGFVICERIDEYLQNPGKRKSLFPDDSVMRNLAYDVYQKYLLHLNDDHINYDFYQIKNPAINSLMRAIIVDEYQNLAPVIIYNLAMAAAYPKVPQILFVGDNNQNTTSTQSNFTVVKDIIVYIAQKLGEVHFSHHDLDSHTLSEALRCPRSVTSLLTRLQQIKHHNLGINNRHAESNITESALNSYEGQVKFYHPDDVTSLAREANITGTVILVQSEQRAEAEAMLAITNPAVLILKPSEAIGMQFTRVLTWKLFNHLAFATAIIPNHPDKASARPAEFDFAREALRPVWNEVYSACSRTTDTLIIADIENPLLIALQSAVMQRQIVIDPTITDKEQTNIIINNALQLYYHNKSDTALQYLQNNNFSDDDIRAIGATLQVKFLPDLMPQMPEYQKSVASTTPSTKNSATRYLELFENYKAGDQERLFPILNPDYLEEVLEEMQSFTSPHEALRFWRSILQNNALIDILIEQGIYPMRLIFKIFLESLHVPELKLTRDIGKIQTIVSKFLSIERLEKLTDIDKGSLLFYYLMLDVFSANLNTNLLKKVHWTPTMLQHLLLCTPGDELVYNLLHKNYLTASMPIWFAPIEYQEISYSSIITFIALRAVTINRERHATFLTQIMQELLKDDAIYAHFISNPKGCSAFAALLTLQEGILWIKKTKILQDPRFRTAFMQSIIPERNTQWLLHVFMSTWASAMFFINNVDYMLRNMPIEAWLQNNDQGHSALALLLTLTINPPFTQNNSNYYNAHLLLTTVLDYYRQNPRAAQLYEIVFNSCKTLNTHGIYLQLQLITCIYFQICMLAAQSLNISRMRINQFAATANKLFHMHNSALLYNIPEAEWLQHNALVSLFRLADGNIISPQYAVEAGTPTLIAISSIIGELQELFSSRIFVRFLLMIILRQPRILHLLNVDFFVKPCTINREQTSSVRYEKFLNIKVPYEELPSLPDNPIMLDLFSMVDHKLLLAAVLKHNIALYLELANHPAVNEHSCRLRILEDAFVLINDSSTQALITEGTAEEENLENSQNRL